MGHKAPQPAPDKPTPRQMSPPPPPKKPEPPRAYLVRENSTRICGYLNHDGTVEHVPDPSRIGRLFDWFWSLGR
jgi:hypothetical protein